MPFDMQEIIVYLFRSGKGAIEICEVLQGVSITGKLEVVVWKVAYIIEAKAYQFEEAFSMPRQGGVPRGTRTKQLSDPEGTACTKAEATAEDGLHPQGVRVLLERHLQVRDCVQECPSSRPGFSLRVGSR